MLSSLVKITKFIYAMVLVFSFISNYSQNSGQSSVLSSLVKISIFIYAMVLVFSFISNYSQNSGQSSVLSSLVKIRKFIYTMVLVFSFISNYGQTLDKAVCCPVWSRSGNSSTPWYLYLALSLIIVKLWTKQCVVQSGQDQEIHLRHGTCI